MIALSDYHCTSICSKMLCDLYIKIETRKVSNGSRRIQSGQLSEHFKCPETIEFCTGLILQLVYKSAVDDLGMLKEFLSQYVQ